LPVAAPERIAAKPNSFMPDTSYLLADAPFRLVASARPA
jgi:hypothetical protein